MLSFPDHLTSIVATLRNVIAAISLAAVRRDPTIGPLFILLWNRVGRAVRLVNRLHELWQQGKLPRPRPSRAGQPRPTRAIPDPTSTPAPRPRIPRGRSWLINLGGWHVVGSASQLQHFLLRPDLAVFLAAVPQAGRHLRPLCRLLAVDFPPSLQLPPRPPRRRPSRARPVSPDVGQFDRPIPRNILAAARAWRPRHG